MSTACSRNLFTASTVADAMLVKLREMKGADEPARFSFYNDKGEVTEEYNTERFYLGALGIANAMTRDWGIAAGDRVMLVYEPGLEFFVALFAGPILGEHVGLQRWLAILVGFAGIRNMALGLVLLEHMQDKTHANVLKDEYVRCLLAGSIAGELCSMAREREEAFIAAMFQNLGRMLAEFYFPEEAREIRGLLHTSRPPLTEAQAAVQVLGQGKPVEVVWQDAGSTPAEVGRATGLLVRAGVEVFVGPVGPGNVEAAVAAATAAGGKPSFIVPGESTAAATGVAPTIEARSAALVAQLSVKTVIR